MIVIMVSKVKTPQATVDPQQSYLSLISVDHYLDLAAFQTIKQTMQNNIVRNVRKRS